MMMEEKPAYACVEIKDGKLMPAAEEVKAALLGGEVSDTEGNMVEVLSSNSSIGGVYVSGEGSDFTLSDAVIKLSGEGSGLGGKISGASVEDHGKLTLKNCFINMDGKLRCATSCGGNSLLKVYDSMLVSHGDPWPVDVKEVTWVMGPGMAKPPVYLEIEGNMRTHCTVMDSESYFYNSTIIADSWAALSTDAGGDRVYLEANDCKVITTRSGYGTYADTMCHCVLNRCDLELANMGAIIAGEADVKFHDCKAKCGSYLALIHVVGGSNTQVSGLDVVGGDIRTRDCAVIVKSENTDILFDGVKVKSLAGVLVRSRVNDDPMAAKVGNDVVYGIHVKLRNMDTENDIIHGDTERRMVIYFENSKLKGAITGGAIVKMDGESSWYADKDSDVVLMGSIDLDKVDAPAGVTITAKGAEAGEYALASGGLLKVN